MIHTDDGYPVRSGFIKTGPPVTEGPRNFNIIRMRSSLHGNETLRQEETMFAKIMALTFVLTLYTFAEVKLPGCSFDYDNDIMHCDMGASYPTTSDGYSYYEGEVLTWNNAYDSIVDYGIRKHKGISVYKIATYSFPYTCTVADISSIYSNVYNSNQYEVLFDNCYVGKKGTLLSYDITPLSCMHPENAHNERCSQFNWSSRIDFDIVQYRSNGTVKADISLEGNTGFVIADCYDHNGMKVIKHANNASSCK